MQRANSEGTRPRDFRQDALSWLPEQVDLVRRIAEHQPLTVAALTMNLASQLTLSCQREPPAELAAGMAGIADHACVGVGAEVKAGIRPVRLPGWPGNAICPPAPGGGPA